MKNKIKQRIILVIALLTVTCLSIPYLGLNFINQADAKIEWFANEGGDNERCIVTQRVRGEEEIAVDRTGFRFKSGDYEILFEGTQGGCLDASIWYACRTHCEIDPGYKRIN
ncbi:hypothetical protein [Roseivirga echinicomitans]|uniref:Uncharacterized protein n=1 Tax=Roseivirga echinicomitans TaxID=296218 RepID=A0A150XJK3_9BACT|nr:hypothetical protein [Roseivirga echinicomitans]KYG78883.1 hypothetical protein AWN68_04450 [Roseivirga echinicomitans]